MFGISDKIYNIAHKSTNMTFLYFFMTNDSMSCGERLR